MPRRGRGAGGRNREERDLPGLRVDPADVALPEVGEIGVVLRVRDDVVDVVRLALRRVLERLPGLDLAGGELEPVHAGKAVVLRPHLAVDVRRLRAHHVDLRRVDVDLGRQRPELERLALAIELHDRRLIHVAEPQVAVAVRAQAERAGREARLVQRDGKFRDLAAARIELAEVLLAEARIPGDAVRIDDHVMRLDRFARQIVFGDDDARALALRARQGLQRIGPRTAAEIDRAQIVGEAAIDLHALVAALLHQPLAAPQLRRGRNALVHIALHARQHLHEVVGGVASTSRRARACGSRCS